MILDVDVDSGAVQLLEPEVLNRFHARSRGTAAQVADTLGAERGYASSKADHVFVSIETLKSLADKVPEGWSKGFEAMIAYAASKGWVDDAGTHVEAHIEAS